MKLIIFQILRFIGFLYILRKIKGKGITVLCFHRVSDEFSPAWPPMKTDVFEKLIKYIVSHYEVITHLDLNEPKSSKPKIILTFDDGYKDFIINALPILEKYNVPAVHHVVVDCVEKGSNIWTQRLNRIIENIILQKVSAITYEVDTVKFHYETTHKSVFQISNEIYLQLLGSEEAYRNKHLSSLQTTYNLEEKNDLMMDWNDLKKCIAKNVIIGSHSYTHTNLALVKDANTIEKEINLSKEVIANKLDTTCDVIGLPNGQYDEVVINKCKEYGYKYIYLLNERLYHFQGQSDFYLIPRLLMQHDSYIENCFKIENFHNIIKSLKK